jgi:hypothetical protein
MSRPHEILNKRYGKVFLSKSKSLKVVSQETNTDQGEFYVVYNTLLDTGSINPTVLSALVKQEANQNPIQLENLNWVSLHVRSYNSWDDLVRAGIELQQNNPQRPTVGALHECTDCQMAAVSETDNSKTYYFDNQGDGKITIFTSKPVISTGGNDLPRKATFLPWVNSPNFVYERN